MKTRTLDLVSPDVRRQIEEGQVRIEGPLAEPLTGDCIEDLFRELCGFANSNFSAQAYEHFILGEYEKLVSLKVDKGSYGDAYSFAKDYAVECFFKKYADFEIPGIDRKLLAHQKWEQAELSCRQINQVFRERWSGEAKCFPHQVEEVLHLARINIAHVLHDEFDGLEFQANCHFGPGADDSTRKGKTSAYSKYASMGGVTTDCADFLSDYLVPSSEDQGPDVRCQLVEHAQRRLGNSLIYVPKNALIDRVISKEPRWNIFAQLGIGEMISRRLCSRARIDIRDQKRNQFLASIAWKYGLCTVDMSSASDCLAVNAVIDLFDYVSDSQWLEAILKTRSPYVRLPDGRMHRLEKVSSMGNGYTFPLETLVFYAVTRACYTYLNIGQENPAIGRTYHVYGDDIVCDDRIYDLLIQTLGYLGFSVNSEKSFRLGVFHESCGCDYYKGENVRPFFVKKNVCTVQAAYTLANQIASFAIRLSGDPRFAIGEVWNLRRYPIRRIPCELRFTGPAILGDSVIHSTLDVYRPEKAQGKPWSILWSVTGLTVSPKGLLGRSYRGHLLSKLHGGTQNGTRFYSRGALTSQISRLEFDTLSDVVLL